MSLNMHHLSILEHMLAQLFLELLCIYLLSSSISRRLRSIQALEGKEPDKEIEYQDFPLSFIRQILRFGGRTNMMPCATCRQVWAQGSLCTATAFLALRVLLIPLNPSMLTSSFALSHSNEKLGRIFIHYVQSTIHSYGAPKHAPRDLRPNMHQHQPRPTCNLRLWILRPCAYEWS